MKGETKFIPDGYSTVTPYLIVSSITDTIQFLKNAFDAKEIRTMVGKDGTPNHSEVEVGSSKVMMGQASGEWRAQPGQFYVYVEDADSTYQRALQAGAKSIMEPKDQFYGDRHGGVIDPVGNTWWIATHIEDVSDEEMERRHAASGR